MFLVVIRQDGAALELTRFNGDIRIECARLEDATTFEPSIVRREVEDYRLHGLATDAAQ